VGSIRIAIPIRVREVTATFAERLGGMGTTTLASLERLRPTCRVQVTLLPNGPEPSTAFIAVLQTLSAVLSSGRQVDGVTTRHEPRRGKIYSINSVIREPIAEDGLVVIDDDLLLAPSTFPEIEAFLCSADRHVAAYCFPKCSISSPPTAGDFARAMSFLYHPATIRALDRTGAFAPRPSGSLYAIRRAFLEPFPDPCNEAEFLVATPHILSSTFARSWVSESPDVERARRTRQHRARLGSPTAPPFDKSASWGADWSSFGSFLEANLPPHLSRRIRRSYDWQRELSCQPGKSTLIDETLGVPPPTL
jgi:hypothetical protein